MPLAPPVTMAARPASRDTALALRDQAAGELLEARELLLDQVDGGLVLELQRLLVEFLRGKFHDYLRPAEKHGGDRGGGPAQVKLHTRAAEDAAGAGWQRRR